MLKPTACTTAFPTLTRGTRPVTRVCTTARTQLWHTRLASGGAGIGAEGASAKVKRELGADGGCFAAAIAAVRRFGGVLEHPEASHAWYAHGLLAPPKMGGWFAAGDWQGWTCCVEQGHYGHRARKATWLYAVRCELPLLRWGASKGDRLEDGFHSSEERARVRAAGVAPVRRLSKAERLATPIAFRDLLLAMARTCANHRPITGYAYAP